MRGLVAVDWRLTMQHLYDFDTTQNAKGELEPPPHGSSNSPVITSKTVFRF
jgi:hypothetical protein